MSRDIVLDTNIAADFLAVFFENKVNSGGAFAAKYRLSVDLVRRVNKILDEYRHGEGVFASGIVVVSSFAFVEIARQFNEISSGRFSLEQFKAFIESPPEWFLIESLNPQLFLLFKEVPEKVTEGNLPIEWADAIHVVTAISRGNNSLLSTTDRRIQLIEGLRNRLI